MAVNIRGIQSLWILWYSRSRFNLWGFCEYMTLSRIRMNSWSMTLLHKQFAKYQVFVFRMGLAELVLMDYIQGYSVGLLFRQQRWIVGKFWHTGLSCSCWRGSLWGYPHLCWHWRLWEFPPLGCRSKERRFFRQCWCRRCKSWQTSCWWCLPGLPDQRSRTTCQGQPVSMVMCHLTWNKICKQIDSKTLLVVQHFIFSFTERLKFYKTWNFRRIFNTCIID